MTVYSLTVAPFRIPEGEQEPEECIAADCEGWMTYTSRLPFDHWRFKTKREACAMRDRLEAGEIPARQERYRRTYLA